MTDTHPMGTVGVVSEFAVKVVLIDITTEVTLPVDLFGEQ